MKISAIEGAAVANSFQEDTSSRYLLAAAMRSRFALQPSNLSHMRRLLWLAVFLLTALPVTAQEDRFVDDDGSVHEENINIVADAGITFGCNPPENDRFCPRDSVTREQMASFLVRAMELPSPTSDHFDDDDGSIHEADINSLADAGVTLGCNPPENTNYCPDDQVAREEIASFLVRAVELPPTDEDYFTDDEGSVHEADINALAQAEVTLGCNPPDNTLYCPDDPVTRGEMASFLVRAFDLGGDQPPPPPPGRPVVELGDSYEVGAPLSWVGSAPGDDRLWATTLDGVVMAGAPNDLRVVHDISDQVSTGGERGLLSMAFHPNYPENGRLFLSYTDNDGDTAIREYRNDDGEFVSDRRLLRLDQPYTNHNGGMIVFGPDGWLYIGLGDGGGGGDPDGNGQNPNTLLGSILRVDVEGDAFADPDRNYGIPPGNDAPGNKPEIWAYGVRNPWRFWIDKVDDRIFIADVGQTEWEEVDVLSLDIGQAANLGWNIMEGSHCYASDSCDRSGLVLPVEEYSHTEGCSITGGPVYRGDVSALDGAYFYSDFCTGFLRSFRLVDGIATMQREWVRSGLEGASSIGVGPDGTFYAVTTDGTLTEIVIRQEPR